MLGALHRTHWNRSAVVVRELTECGWYVDTYPPRSFIPCPHTQLRMWFALCVRRTLSFWRIITGSVNFTLDRYIFDVVYKPVVDSWSQQLVQKLHQISKDLQDTCTLTAVNIHPMKIFKTKFATIEGNGGVKEKWRCQKEKLMDTNCENVFNAILCTQSEATTVCSNMTFVI